MAARQRSTRRRWRSKTAHNAVGKQDLAAGSVVHRVLMVVKIRSWSSKISLSPPSRRDCQGKFEQGWLLRLKRLCARSTTSRMAKCAYFCHVFLRFFFFLSLFFTLFRPFTYIPRHPPRRDVDVGEKRVLLSRVKGRYYATSNVCTHYKAPLSKGVLSEDGRVMCPWHAACFNVKSGDIEDAPAFDHLAKHAVRIEGDNVIVTAKVEDLERGALRKIRGMGAGIKVGHRVNGSQGASLSSAVL